MKIIVTHRSGDPDSICSVWLIKRFLPNWDSAKVEFVDAGDKLKGLYVNEGDFIEIVNGDEVIHVDTGLGKLDHHQIKDNNISAASLVYDYILSCNESLASHSTKKEAVRRIVELVVDDDQFQQVYYENPLAFYHDFSFLGIMDGYKLQNPGKDEDYIEFGVQCLDFLLHTFEYRVWAEKEIEEKGMEFKSKWGKGLAIETINDNVMELGQKMGYMVVVRRDPNNNFVRIKAKPESRLKINDLRLKNKEEIDLTPVYEKLKEMDPNATWFLHVSKHMLLNGSTKNPKMRGTKLSLQDIIKIFEELT